MAGEPPGQSAQHIAARLSGRLGLKINALDRALTSAKADTFLPAALSMAVDLGRTWLERHKADLLIWGDTAPNGGWRLRFVSRSVSVQPGAAIDRLEVPALFSDIYSDLVFACALAIAELETGAQFQTRRALLDPLMSSVRDLTEGDHSGTVAEGATALANLGAALKEKGNVANSEAILAKAAEAFRQAGEVFTELNMERYVAIVDAEVDAIEQNWRHKGRNPNSCPNLWAVTQTSESRYPLTQPFI